MEGGEDVELPRVAELPGRVLNLGRQTLTGVFPRSADEPLTEGPLELVWNPVSGLVQLRSAVTRG
jgi:hypothetical protein